jgi:hypothetical protein
MSETTKDELQAGLEARAEENAKTVEGWTVEKQAHYEQFMAAEKIAEERRRANSKPAGVLDTALASIAAYSPKPAEPNDDPWLDVLATLERLPNTPGCVHRKDGYIKITTKFILNEVLGVHPERGNNSAAQRLSHLMEQLGWEKPEAIKFGSLACRGYQKWME